MSSTDFSVNIKKKRSNIISNSSKCINCMKCTKGCPIIMDGYSTPKEFIENVESGERFNVSDSFSCLSCGFCKSVCPKEIDIQALIYEHKSDLIINHKKCINNENDFHKKYKVVKNHQKNSFRPTMIQAERKGRLFFPGCALTGARFELVQKISKELESIGVGSFSGCCGSPFLHIGDYESFNESIKKIIDTLNENGVTEIIVACSNCLKAFEKIITSMEKDIKVSSLYSVITEIISDREFSERSLAESFIIHDPCPTRDNENLHEDVRILAKKMNINVNEFNLNRKYTTCCGDGGMASVMAKSSKNFQLLKRVAEAGENSIISYCQSCVNNFRSKGNESLHILELIYPDISIKEYGTLMKWINRYKYARYIRLKGE